MERMFYFTRFGQPLVASFVLIPPLHVVYGPTDFLSKIQSPVQQFALHTCLSKFLGKYGVGAPPPFTIYSTVVPRCVMEHSHFSLFPSINLRAIAAAMPNSGVAPFPHCSFYPRGTIYPFFPPSFAFCRFLLLRRETTLEKDFLPLPLSMFSPSQVL